MKVHLRLDGRSRSLDRPDIDPGQSDDQILERLARTLDLPRLRPGDAIVDRNPDAIVVRPPAVFG
jgi:hypothetical protein